jgi:hypothetical protein
VTVHAGGAQADSGDQGRETVKDFFDRVWRRIQDVLRAAGWTAQALLVGAMLASLASCADARAVTVANAGRLDQVRLGFAVGLDGRVGYGCTASKFALHDPIYLSMQVNAAPSGSVVRVAVRDTVTQRVAWSEDRTVAPGESYATFAIGRQLAQGRYRADASLGGGATTPREFVVHAWNGNPN